MRKPRRKSQTKARTLQKDLWDKHGGPGKADPFSFGPHFSRQFRRHPRRILFSFSRYKFAQRMIGSGKGILELGCSDGTGMMSISEGAKRLCGVDFDAAAIDWAKQNFSEPKMDFPAPRMSFHCEDFLGKKYGSFDGVISFDVIAHIYPRNEALFVRTTLDNLNKHGVLVVGTPNIEANRFVPSKNQVFSVNKFSGERLVTLLSKYFNHVFLFSQNDEMIHTGFAPMAHYLLCVCCGKKEARHHGVGT